MGTTGNLTLLTQIGQIGGGAVGLIGAITQAGAERTKARLASESLAFQAQVAERRALDAIRRGQLQESRQRTRTRRLIGSQRAALAAQGIDISTGSAFDVQRETAELGGLDAVIIRNNAAREALGFRLGVGELRLQRAFEQIAGRERVRATLLTGGLQFISTLGEAAREPGRRIGQ